MLKSFLQKVSEFLSLRRFLQTRLEKFGGKFQVEHRDKDGNLVGIYDLPNGIVDVGLNSLLGVYFHADSQITAWFIGLVDNSGFSAFAAADTMGSHSGWNEFTTYTEGNRVAWAEDASSGRSITNTTSSDFSITGSGTIKGIFVVDENTKSGTSGTLWATAAFATNVGVLNGDSLKITYTVSG